MDCEQALEAISAALDGELPPRERAKLSEHLMRCPDCRELAEDLRVLTDILENSEQAPPPELAASIRDAVAGGTGAPRARNKRRPPCLPAVAAMLALCVLLGGAGLFALRGIRMGSAGNAAPAAMTGEEAVDGADYAYYGSGGPTADGEAAPREAEEPALPMPSSAPESAPAPENDGFGDPGASPGAAGDNGMAPGMIGAAPQGMAGSSGENAGITPEEALELARDFFTGGGPEEDNAWTFTHLGLSPNRKYYLFEVRPAQSGNFRTVLAVALDGGEVLVQQDDGFEDATER